MRSKLSCQASSLQICLLADPPVIGGIKLALDRMANESFELGRELTGAFRRATQVDAAKSDKSLPIQQICVCVCVVGVQVCIAMRLNLRPAYGPFFSLPERDCVHPALQPSCC